MTDGKKVAPQPAPDDSSTPGPRLGRRLLVLKVAVGGAAMAAATPMAAEAGDVTPVQYRTGITDADPGDGPGFGRGGYRGPPRTGLTDSDPGDGPGYGRGGYRAPARPQGRAYTGINDGDPGDPSGYGTGWRQRGQPYTGINDSDPSDGAGRGRGGYRRNVTDSDPGDAPGRGRGYR
ncbi:hypothetical protein J5Y09_17300 [Roseomonas sp. PWR1]|uniref:Translation initiation factor IF-2 n=1 Tax=Roseomonas nitratireducens TaxID=2820810 RepID=A0ABS4AYT3_9PROT|nr:hypothetical protein [Neoroseomonas nitratireducens]MBP0465687.1 hypothetical protein [Neoroseomonas nitratireducens]